MNKLLLASLLLPLTTYIPLRDQTWKSCSESSYTISHDGTLFTTNYKFCTIGSNITSKQIKKEIEKDTKAIFEYADSRGYSSTQCVANSNLEIYDIRVETLNKQGRFPAWINPSPDGIWSLYDPRVNDYNTSALMLTDHGTYWNQVTLAHELSHYWYDRLCWNKYQSDPERFAMAFERYYFGRNK